MCDPDNLASLERIDSQVAEIVRAEERRQRQKLILIPSESLTPPAIREALASAFTSVYAEGYPRAAMREASPKRLADLAAQLSSHRRYADWRFYKGTEMADIVESLACRRAAECFATELHPAETIHANVQPLSGAAANLAIYEAFVKPGDTMMGLDLREGGHLSHGSEFHLSGRRYRIVSYASDPSTGRLDYDAIRELATAERPKMIIAGFTSFPWQPDWAAFRSIADEVGAILFADIAHVAGMVIGGAYPNPIDHAHVVGFTTHKTLCGPRGAVILSSEPEIADRIDAAVFPGEQGGPHVNKFAAIATALSVAATEEFRAMQREIVDNAALLAAALQENGLTLAYGGTDTHLMVVDLRPLETDTGFQVMGEIAARILDLAGIVCNKNTIPGDSTAADARGIRLGTPWATQRGMDREAMTEIARIVATLLKAIRPFEYIGLSGQLSRGKLPMDTLQAARADVRELIVRYDSQAFPRSDATADHYASGATILRVRGGRSAALLQEACPADVESLPTGEHINALLFDGDGRLIAEPVICRLGDDDFLLLVHRSVSDAIQEWLIGLADGYIVFDNDDLFRKVQGPAVIEEIGAHDVPESGRPFLALAVPGPRREETIAALHERHPEQFDLSKPYFVGQSHLPLPPPDDAREPFTWSEPSDEVLRETQLHSTHRQLGARLVSFAGWEMPAWYSSAIEEHRAVRQTAGLFDLGHMGVFSVSGRHAASFLNALTSNYADWLAPGESQYAYLLRPDGAVIDDIWVYRRATDRFLLVVNAANEEKDWAWLTGVNERRYLIDEKHPGRRASHPVSLQNLKDERSVVDIALQGPCSQEILERILDPRGRVKVASLRRTAFCEHDIDGHQLLIARTGYTGESVGYEIYAGGDDVPWLWQSLLEAGEPLGLRPVGLAARDSTRTEAGFPLYGHELAGPHGIDPFEAGFAAYVKLHKPFFVGRGHCVAAYRERMREVIRFEVSGGDSRPVHEGAVVIDRGGRVLGRVTSCVSLGETQIGMALLENVGAAQPGTAITILEPQRRDEVTKGSSELAAGDRVAIPIAATVLARFREAASLPVRAGE
ncbi:MAG: serine hydroxymethyltransferase [Candidatus Bipolaricaulota bacterium]|nr:MAG: serine hydroxymethyltransferase [Candidatus Bipolaricaulota bacterium]